MQTARRRTMGRGGGGEGEGEHFAKLILGLC